MSTVEAIQNPYDSILKTIQIGDKNFKYYDVASIDEKYHSLPFSIRILLESSVRNCDGFQVKQQDVENIINWKENQHKRAEIPFRPSRVILQDFTGIPALVDFAAMRDAVKSLGGDPRQINPVCPADLVIDHSVQVDVSRTDGALKKNQELEFQRNKERFCFLKWGAQTFKNMSIVPPGSGIVHQVNLEYLARCVFINDNLLYPDSVVGTDSHTTMINGLGIVGWGVGGIEAEAVMLGQAISMVLPSVVGYKITGTINQLCTSTDIVLTITKHLRQVGVVGKFVEFFGEGISQLSIADRATIANMCPEYGATIGFFPFDELSIKYLQQTARDQELIDIICTYLKNQHLFHKYSSETKVPEYSEIVELDLSTVVPCCSGPKRPHDKVAVSDMHMEFRDILTAKVGFKGFGLSQDVIQTEAQFKFNDKDFSLKHGSVVIAAITSCTNTSNPSVMLGAGILAKNAIQAGLSVPEYVKSSLSPGSGVVTYYLKESGVLKYLEELGFNLVGYGCMTCIGNSGPLDPSVAEAIEKNNLVVCGVLSGNRNFEGRIHPLTRANYLASPLLVIAYALAGRIDIDFENEPLGINSVTGNEVFLHDLWPSRDYIQQVEREHVLPAMFKQVYSNIHHGTESWRALDPPNELLYSWDPSSTYIKSPPFFHNMPRDVPKAGCAIPIRDAAILLLLGDSVTTDHISPAGSIARNSPAARYLASHGLAPRDFNSYGSRRGNDQVMARGTFANIRLVNLLLGSGDQARPSPRTRHLPSGDIMDVFDAAERYRIEGRQVIILAGNDYGAGSSRDWAAKGPWMLGVKAVIAQSYERIHRSNLIGMGIAPLQYQENQSAAALGLTGCEQLSIDIPPVDQLRPRQLVMVRTDNGLAFQVIARFDTDVELEYFRHGGILNYMIRKML